MKLLIALNRMVFFVLIGVCLTVMLQLSGVASTAKDSTDFEALAKPKSDYSGDVIDGIFNIPIATLKAVSDLVQTTGPLFRQATELRKANLAERLDLRQAKGEVLAARAANREAKNEAKRLRKSDKHATTYVIQKDTYLLPREEIIVLDKDH